MPQYQFLTNHAQVLLCVAHDPGIRLRDIAETVGVTERSAHRILSELVEDGYVDRERVGRRNVYKVKPELPLRHPLARTRSSEGLAICSKCFSGRTVGARPHANACGLLRPPRGRPRVRKSHDILRKRHLVAAWTRPTGRGKGQLSVGPQAEVRVRERLGDLAQESEAVEDERQA